MTISRNGSAFQKANLFKKVEMFKKAVIFLELVPSLSRSLCQYQFICLVALSVFELKLRMIVITNALLLVYNIKLSIIHMDGKT